MKRFVLRFMTFIMLLSFLAGCETDFDVTAPWKDITVVYGLISQNDSVHYIKVNKAFLGEGNAYTYAQIADSSSYGDNIEVTIVEKAKNGSTRSFACEPTTVFDKEPGIFYYPEQEVYKTTFKVPVNYTEQELMYSLVIRNKITGKIVSAQTPLVKDFTIETPRPAQQIDFISENNQKIKWISAKDGRRYNIAIRFWFADVMETTHDTVARYIDWNLTSTKSSTIEGGESLEILYSPLSFYEVCKNLVPVRESYGLNYTENDVDVRLADRFEFRFMVAGDELNTYMEVNEPATGIVQEKPEYTNIVNGIGLFSSRYTKFISIPVGSRTQDNLVEQNIRFIKKIGK
ncbi:MAG: DUF4249 family protein [Bacteroidales bacterium]|nr:DUF4249 family protein [Bacteroidales bacterium]